MNTTRAGTLPRDAEDGSSSNSTRASVTTGLFAVLMTVSGVAYLVGPAPIVDAIRELGYPAYFRTLLGIAKLLGVLGILLPSLPRLREWAYAGFAFDLVAAIASHAITGSISHAVPAVIALLLLSASYVLRRGASDAPAELALRPAWLSRALFPFESRFLWAGGTRFHYVDEGHGKTLLFLHGGPMSSFMWRNQLGALRARYRCVAVDLPGLGLSRAPLERGRGFERIADELQAFVRCMELDDFTLIVHATGGPSGLELAIRERARVERLVISNAFAWPLSEWTDPRAAKMRKIVRIVSSGVFGYLVVALNLLPRVAARMGRRHASLSAEERAAVLGPYEYLPAREHLANLLYGLRVEAPFFAQLESRLSALAGLPALLAFGEEDNGYRAGSLERFASAFPTHTSVVIPGAAHFITEDAPEAYTAALDDWLGRTDGELANGRALVPSGAPGSG